AADLRDDPARLSDEASALSLTGGRRLVHIREATDATANILAGYVAQPVGDALVLVEAGTLGPRSRLRAAFEKAEGSAAVACYADDGRSLAPMIRTMLGEANCRVSDDALAYLVANLGGDRLVSRSELEKLCLYMGPEGGEVTLTDAAACVGDSATMTLDDISFAVGGGDINGLPRLLDRAHHEGAAPVGVLRAVSRHFQRLHLAASAVEGGRPMEGALKALRPPVFFKQADQFRAQLRHWPSRRLGDALEALGEAEVACKTTGLPSDAVCNQALLRLATLGRRLAARQR
ncbi:MAG: DNA polymerase III subunit delta, partial [Alphaproteobacteria bacterium]